MYSYSLYLEETCSHRALEQGQGRHQHQSAVAGPDPAGSPQHPLLLLPAGSATAAAAGTTDTISFYFGIVINTAGAVSWFDGYDDAVLRGSSPHHVELDCGKRCEQIYSDPRAAQAQMDAVQ